MKVHDIITEGRIKDIEAIIDNAEGRAYDEAAESKSAVSGDMIHKYAMQELEKLGYDDFRKRAAKKIIAQEIAKREQSSDQKIMKTGD